MLRTSSLIQASTLEKDSNAWVGNNGVDTGVSYTPDAKFRTSAVFINAAKVSHNPIVITKEMTFCFWLYRLDSSGNAFYLMQRNTYYDTDFLIFNWTSNNRLSFDFGYGDITRWVTGYSIPQFKWIHVCLTRRSTGRELYIDAVLKSSTNDAGFVNNNATEFIVGNIQDGSVPADAKITHLHICNKALSESDIKRVMVGLHPLNG